MISMQVDAEKVIARFLFMPDKLHKAMEKTLTGLAIKLQEHVRKDKLTGQVLKFHTHHLQQSIQYKIENTSEGLVATVFNNSSIAPYGKIHEFGGTFNRIVKVAWGRPVKNPKSFPFTYPQRSFMRSGFNDMRAEIQEALASTGTKSLKE